MTDTPKKTPKRKSAKKKSTGKKTPKPEEPTVGVPDVTEAEEATPAVEPAPAPTPEPAAATEEPSAPPAEPSSAESSAPPAPEPETPSATPEAPEGKPDTDKAAAVAEAAKKAASSAEQVLGSSLRMVKEAITSTDSNTRTIDKILNWTRRVFPASLFDTIAEYCTRYGLSVIVVAQLLAVIFWVSAAIKKSSWHCVALAIASVAALACAQYVAARALEACKREVSSMPTTLRVPFVLDCSAVLLELGGVLYFCFQLAMAWIQKDMSPFWHGLLVWAACDVAAFACVHPSVANVTVSEASDEDEALGLTNFVAKGALAITPLLFGVGVLVGTVALAVGFYPLFKSGNGVDGIQGLLLVGGAALLPIAAYLAFLIYRLLLRVVKAILAIPAG